jgi:hypothetical protein
MPFAADILLGPHRLNAQKISRKGAAAQRKKSRILDLLKPWASEH